MQWDLSKENIQPLKRGRNPAALEKVFVANQKQDAAEIENRMRELEQAVHDYAGDDPIKPWEALIDWVRQHVQSGADKFLKPVYQRATEHLRQFERYKADRRYLRMWIMYADMCRDPNDVFTTLRQHDIGQDFALFYEAYATWLERKGSHASADAVYRDGIGRNAEPIARLKLKYDAFQARMALRIQREAEQGVHREQPAPERQAFVPLAARTSGRVGSRRPGGSPARAALAPVRGAAGAAAPNSGLDVFVDEQFGGEEGAAAEGAAAGAAGAEAGAAARPAPSLLGLDNPKENVMQATSWQGARIKQIKSASVQPAPALDVLEDPDIDAGPVAHGAAGASAPQHAPCAPGEGFAKELLRMPEGEEECCFEERRALDLGLGHVGRAVSHAVSGLDVCESPEKTGGAAKRQNCQPTPEAARAAGAALAAAAAQGDGVTINTKLAFDEINAMFSDALPHEALRTAAAAPSRPPAAPPSPAVASPDADPGMAIYEDTIFLRGDDNRAPRPSGAAAAPTQTLALPAGAPGPARAAADEDEEFLIYEDTVCIKKNTGQLPTTEAAAGPSLQPRAALADAKENAPVAAAYDPERDDPRDGAENAGPAGPSQVRSAGAGRGVLEPATAERVAALDAEVQDVVSDDEGGEVSLSARMAELACARAGAAGDEFVVARSDAVVDAFAPARVRASGRAVMEDVVRLTGTVDVRDTELSQALDDALEELAESGCGSLDTPTLSIMLEAPATKGGFTSARVLAAGDDERTFHGGGPGDDALMAIVTSPEAAALAAHVAGRLASRGVHATSRGIWTPTHAVIGARNALLLGPLGEGVTLQSILARAGTPEPPVGLALAASLLEAVGTLHSQGYVHGAISPACIVLVGPAVPGAAPGLLLAGADKLVDVAAMPRGTKLAGVPRGDGAYVAPSVAAGEPWVFVGDNWGVGAVVGRLLGVGESPRGVAEAVRSGRFPDVVGPRMREALGVLTSGKDGLAARECGAAAAEAREALGGPLGAALREATMRLNILLLNDDDDA